MQKTLLSLLMISSCNFALGTTYNYISPTGVSTYTMPTQAPPTNGTQMAGQLAGNLAAASAARAANNPAAIMGTQNALLNTGATAFSTAVMTLISPALPKPNS